MVTIERPGPIDPNGPCANTRPTDDQMVINLPDSESYNCVKLALFKCCIQICTYAVFSERTVEFLDPLRPASREAIPTCLSGGWQALQDQD